MVENETAVIDQPFVFNIQIVRFALVRSSFDMVKNKQVLIFKHLKLIVASASPLPNKYENFKSLIFEH